MSYIKLEKKFKLLLGTITSVAPLSFVLSCTNHKKKKRKQWYWSQNSYKTGRQAFFSYWSIN